MRRLLDLPDLAHFGASAADVTCQTCDSIQPAPLSDRRHSFSFVVVACNKQTLAADAFAAADEQEPGGGVA